MKVQIEQAADLLQMITKDIEDNFIGTAVNSIVKARATLTVSALSVLHNYLRAIGKENEI